MKFIKNLWHIILIVFLLFTLSCNKDSEQITNPTTNSQPEYSKVFDHGQGDLCYYPQVATKGRYVAIEREEIVSPPGYVAHIWLYDMLLGNIRQLTTNPDEGYYDDRNLRFAEDDTYIYFLRIHWHADGSWDRRFCRIPIDGSEDDVEQMPGNEMQIYQFDILSNDSTMLIAYYNQNTQEYHTGFLNIQTGNITSFNHLKGQRHNCLVPLPDESGFIASTGSPGSDLFSYKITRHMFNGQLSEVYANPPLEYIVWTLSINPSANRLLVHQGVCTKSKTHYVPLSDGTATQILTDYNIPCDASWEQIISFILQLMAV